MLKRVRAVLAVGLLTLSVTALSACSSGQEYTPALEPATLSTPAIGQAGVLRVGVNTDKSPLAGLGNDKIIGIDVDIAAAMADDMGLKLEVVDVGSDAQKAIADDKVDVVLGVDSSETQTDMWTSENYIPTGVSLFALTSRNAPVPTTTSKPEIAAQVSSKSAWAVSNTFGEECLESTVDLATAFSDLAAGNIEYVASDAIIGMYAANRQGIDVDIIALLEPAGGYCAATAPDNTELQSAVKNTLNTLKSNGIIDVIETKWLGKPLDFASIGVVEGHKVSTADTDDDADAEDGEGADGDGADGTSNTSSSSGTSGNAASGTSNTAATGNTSNTATGTNTAA